MLRYIWIEAFFYPCIFKCYLFGGKEVILCYIWKQHTTKSIAQALNKPQVMCLGSYINSNNTPFTICLPSVRTDGWPLTNPMPQNCVFQYLMNERLRLSFIRQLLLNYWDDAERDSFRLWNTFLLFFLVESTYMVAVGEFTNLCLCLLHNTSARIWNHIDSPFTLSTNHTFHTWFVSTGLLSILQLHKFTQSQAKLFMVFETRTCLPLLQKTQIRQH